MEKLLELIARNPSIGKQTTREDIQLMNKYHKELFGGPIKDTSCHTCLLTAFNKLRTHCGYAPLNNVESKNITKQRLQICYTCEYRVQNVLGDTCGQFANKLKDNPQTTSSGKVLCGCILKLKARTSKKWLLRLNDWCATDRWDM